MKYLIEITEVLQKIVEVEAGGVEEAISIVKQDYRKEKYVLNENDYIHTEISFLRKNR